MTVMQRLQSPTPLFFKKVRRIGFVLTAISGAILTAQVSLPEAVVSIATYLGIAGSVASAVSQAATEDDVPKAAKQHKSVSV